jgi:tRNA(Ile)-lysidine synthase
VLEAARRFLGARALRGRRIAVGFSGGLDSTVLLHVLRRLGPALGYRLAALHVHHGLSPNANAWRAHCAAACRAMGVPFASRRVKVRRAGKGLEAAAREARRRVFMACDADAVALAHHLDDQAETVLHALLRGAGPAGASGMPAVAKLGGKLLLRPLLELPREALLAYARAQRLAWIEDESNADESFARNFLRQRVGALLATRFPRWRESLARAARHFARAHADARLALREFLAAQGLRAPSEARLLEMLKQLGSGSARMALAHDGKVLRAYRGRVALTDARAPGAFRALRWRGERRLALPALGGELRFRRARGSGIDAAKLAAGEVTVRRRSGGERLQPDARRPRRTLKNLFQEAGVPPWEREWLPLLYCGDDLVWAPGLGIDASYQAARGAPAWIPEWLRGDA